MRFLRSGRRHQGLRSCPCSCDVPSALRGRRKDRRASSQTTTSRIRVALRSHQSRRGKHQIDQGLPGWNASSIRRPWLVLRDLDHDDFDTCIPGLRTQLLGSPWQEGMCFRLVVRSVEAWILADHEGFSKYFGVRQQLPSAVDDLDDPKRELINRCRRSNKRDIKLGVPPRQGSGRKLGPDYVALITDFSQGVWSPSGARKRSPSLDRALRDLDRLRNWIEQQLVR